MKATKKGSRSFRDAAFGTGRLLDIIATLKTRYNINTIQNPYAKQKLDALCEALQLTHEQFDQVIAEQPQVLRTVQGHAFEVVFDRLLAQVGVPVTVVGGDDFVDRVVNDYRLQLKTPNKAGTRGYTVQYKTHKTHGAKSELESMSYYHAAHDFADYLVGLISYQPLRVIFIPRAELPRHKKDVDRIQSPFSVRWDNHPGLNAFHLIGIKDMDLEDIMGTFSSMNNETLPKTATKLGLTTDIILDTLLAPSNFRIWDMSIRGFARQEAFKDLLERNRVHSIDPRKVRFHRADKADIALFSTSDQAYRFFQLKGLSVNNCRFDGSASQVVIETQLTRGRVNDHPTQSRLYLVSDFDYLLVAIDPSLVQVYRQELGLEAKLEWEFYSIPTSKLKLHEHYSAHLKPIQRFNYQELKSYRVDDAWLVLWQKDGLD